MLGTPPAFILSQNQTLQLRITHKSNHVAHKTLIQVLFAPTRYLFVKDPCPFRQEEIVSIDSLSHRQALSSFFFQSTLRSILRKGRVNFLTPLLPQGQPFFSRSLSRRENKKVLATTYFPTSGLAVSLALEVLTSEFGMESGGSPPPWSPGRNMEISMNFFLVRMRSSSSRKKPLGELTDSRQLKICTWSKFFSAAKPLPRLLAEIIYF